MRSSACNCRIADLMRTFHSRQSHKWACLCVQVDIIVRPQLGPMDTDALTGWLADLKTQSGQCTREFETARNWLKQVRTDLCHCIW